MKSLASSVDELTTFIQAGRTMDARELLYADDVVMQENHDPPRLGKSICLTHEQNMLAPVVLMKAMLVRQAVNEGSKVVFSE